MKAKNLNKKHDFLPTLLGFIADPAAVLNSAGTIVAANKATEKYTGIKIKDLIGKNLLKQQIFDKEITEITKTNLKKRLNGVHIPPYEITIKGKNGKTTQFEIKAKKIKDGKQSLDVIVFHDVTKRLKEQKDLKRELLTSELKFKTISDSTFDGIILFDSKEKIRYWNTAAQRIYGYNKNEVLGKALKETIIPPHAFAQLKGLIKPKNMNRATEFPGLKKDGTEFPTEISLSTIDISGKNLFVATVRDITERKNAESTRKQQQDMLEAVTDSTRIGLTLIDKDYKILWTNNLIKQIFGYNVEQKICFSQLFNRAKICVDCGIKKVFEGSEVETREVTGTDRKGKKYSLQVITSPLKDKNGQVVAVLEISVPNTEKKQMEKKVKEAENLYHALFEQTPLGVMLIDPRTTSIVQFNDTAHRQLGYTREQFGKLKIQDIEDLYDSQGIRLMVNKVLEEGHTEFLTKHRTKNGEIRIVLVNQRKIELSGKELVLVTCNDVTGINRMQDALQNSEEKFYGIANAIKDPLILVDEEAKIIYWNPAAEKTFDYTSKEAIGKVVHELVVPTSMCLEGKERIKESVKIFSETGMGYFTVGNVEVITKRRNGIEFPAELTICPIKLSGKWNAVAIVKDITLRKLNDQRLKDAEQRYHTLFNQAPLGVMVVDPTTATLVEFNETAHLQLGYTREEFESLKIFDIEARETPREIVIHLKEISEKGGHEFETIHRTKKGEIRNVIVTTRAFQSAGKTYLHVICHDITDSKIAQNELVRSEAKYRQLVELAEEGIWAIDNNLNTVFVNPRMANMLGYQENEMTGKSLSDFLDPKLRDTIVKIIQTYQPGMKNQYEYAFPHKKGSRIETSVNLSIITDEKKQKTGVLAVISDITQRKRIENALKESWELSRAIVANAPIGIATSDTTYHFVTANDAFCNILGYSEEELRKLTFKDLTHPQDLETSIQNIKALQKGEIASYSAEKRYLKKDGSTIVGRVIVNAIKDRKGKPVLMIVELEDITLRKRLEDELRQERDLLESVTASTDIVLSIVDKDYRTVWANQTAKKIMGRDDLENKYCYETFGEGKKEICEGCGVKRIFEGNESIVRRDYVTKINGKDFWSELVSTPIKNKNGKVVAALEIAIDINERKQLQNKLADYSQRLEEIVQKRTEQLKKTQAELVKSERLAAIGELAGMIGHDLRNPLTGIKNSAYFMKKKGDKLPSEQSKEMLDIIDRCVDYSNRIINDLLDYSRAINLTLEQETPKKLLDCSLTFITIPKTIEISNRLEEKPFIKVDPDKIKRVFINLIKNAVDAMPNGGKIMITSQQLKDRLEIYFTDTGIGISEEILPKLFSPLFTTKAQGMGFGLAICKRIIEAHGGTITVKTAKDQGTTFTLNLPLEPKIENGGENVWINVPESSLSTTMIQ